MLVGYRLGSILGYKQEALDFVKRTTFFTDPKIPENIITFAGKGINVFTQKVTLEDILAQPFEVTPLATNYEEYFVVSTANFVVEAEIMGGILRLGPTSFKGGSEAVFEEIKKYQKLGLLKIIPNKGQSTTGVIEGGNAGDMNNIYEVNGVIDFGHTVIPTPYKLFDCGTAINNAL